MRWVRADHNSVGFCPTWGASEMNARYLKMSDGSFYDFAEPIKTLPSIDVIADMLSKMTRWRGATHVPYSVASHSNWCCQAALGAFPNDSELALHCLLHDAAEIITGDIPAPVKGFIGEAPMLRRLTDDFDAALFARAHLARRNKARKGMVKAIDMAALLAERNALTCHGQIDDMPVWPDLADCLSKADWPGVDLIEPRHAADRFVSLYDFLQAERRQKAKSQ